MSRFHTPTDLALYLHELLSQPERMVAMRKLVEAYRAGREQGTVGAIKFPAHPHEGVGEWADYDLPGVTPAQGAAALAALHDLHCPGVEKVISIPTELHGTLDDVMPPELRCEWKRTMNWMALLDRVRNVANHALPWFALQLRRFEKNLTDPSGPDSQSKEPPADGTVQDGRIWLKGKPYRLTQGLHYLLSYLLANPGVSEEQTIRDIGMSTSSHLHKRLKDLRDKLTVVLKKSGWRLQIKTEQTHISYKWEEVK